MSWFGKSKRQLQLDRIEGLLLATRDSVVASRNDQHQFFTRSLKMATDLQAAVQRVSDAVAAETTIDQSVLTLVSTMAQEIKDLAANQNDPAVAQQLNAFADSMATNASQLSAAVTANTPAPAPTPAPTA